jgi:NitT/TauT family transport system ATP-binding protein
MADKIVIKNLGKVYPGSTGAIVALQHIDLTVHTGEFLCIVGPSGCGKSTLLRILAAIYQQSSGELLVHGASRNGHPVNAMVFQEYALFPWRTILDNVAFGLEMHGVPRRERQTVAHTYLHKVGLSRFASHYPYQLSGGMKQRVALARAFASNPEILLMDEPFGALDAQTRTLMQEELLTIWDAERKTVVYITHSIEEAVILGDRVVIMTARPGTIKTIYPVHLPRPRSLAVRTTPEFQALTQTIWADLVEEVNKSRALEWSSIEAPHAG